MKRLALALAAAGLSAAVLPSITVAQTLPRTYAYAVDAGGNIVRSGYNACWRTGYWTEALAIAECETVSGKVEAPKPTPAPAPVVVAPPPPPKPVVAEPPPPPRKIGLAGKSSFAVGKSALSPAGQAQIDSEVVAKLGGFATIEAITIEGHTDPMGNEKRNVELSKARAESVRSYLVSKCVKPELIKTEGKGSSQPLPDVKCDAKLPKGRLSACYEPLRRIEIDVKGVAK